MAKRRIQKKHYRIVREALAAGKALPAFYMFRVREYWDDFFVKRYLTVFRPWWYENLENRGQLDFKAEHHKHFNETMRLFIQQTGIDLKRLGEELEKLNRPERKRKPRKEPPPEPIRKLKRPERFTIQVREIGGRIVKQEVEGEKVFEVNGYSFWIRHDGVQWIVSDVVVGAAISFESRYKAAVNKARERIEKNWDHYLKNIEKFEERRKP